jgi:hypothetical protein
MNDGSIASRMEDWIVAQLNDVEEFHAEAKVFPGTVSPQGRELVDELTANRSPYTVVFFESDVPIVTQEGQQDYEPTYAIYVTVQNERGAARHGDGVTPGTNLLRDRLRTALHNKTPGLAANGFAADRTEFRGCRVVYQRNDAFVIRAELVVREVPVA